MNLLPKSKEDFSQKAYWDKFFKKRGNKAFEWYGEYPELAKHLHKYIKIQDKILIMGCGNSTLGRDLYDVGCKNITNIDISKIVIKQMQSQNDKNRPELKYFVMDATNTTFNNEEFNDIIDKGTLDALMPDQSADTLNLITKYFKEIQRLLKNNGRYICVSLLQEHILHHLLAYFPSNNWIFRVIRCFEPEAKSAENGESTLFPVFMVICTKFTHLPRKILEINLGNEENKLLKCTIEAEIEKHISGAQKAAFVCSSLQKSKLDKDSEIELEIFHPNNQKTPRYTVFVVESHNSDEIKNNPYAAFIVPQGRESEWLFSTKTGRKNLASMTKNTRLIIVTMHRGEIYDSLDAVKKELEDIVRNLAPVNLAERKIPFLTLGTDLGKRTVRYEGNSKFSGKYVVEDVEHDDSKKYRRLFYLSSQLVIQSEAKLKTLRLRNGTKKDVVDLTTLTCQHHIYMSMAAAMIAGGAKMKNNAEIVVLGLGGGGLCSFLRKFLPNVQITAVEIDEEMLKIATQWFGFEQDEQLKAEILDGLEFVDRLSSTNSKYVDAILCDVDSKNVEIGMSCPPKEFLSRKFLNSVAKTIQTRGIFVVNVVLRDETLRLGILKDFQDIFKIVVSYKLTEDLNEVFICTNIDDDDDQSTNVEYFKKHLENAAESINSFFKHNNVDEEVDLTEYLNNLKIN